MTPNALRQYVARLLLWFAIIMTICAAAGGWDGLVYGTFGMLAGAWTVWTAGQHARTD